MWNYEMLYANYNATHSTEVRPKNKNQEPSETKNQKTKNQKRNEHANRRC